MIVRKDKQLYEFEGCLSQLSDGFLLLTTREGGLWYIGPAGFIQIDAVKNVHLAKGGVHTLDCMRNGEALEIASHPVRKWPTNRPYTHLDADVPEYIPESLRKEARAHQAKHGWNITFKESVLHLIRIGIGAQQAGKGRNG